MASSRTSFMGKHNTAQMNEKVICVGRCQKGYHKYHGNRVHKLTALDPGKLSIYINGCPVGVEEIKSGISSFL